MFSLGDRLVGLLFLSFISLPGRQSHSRSALGLLRHQ